MRKIISITMVLLLTLTAFNVNAAKPKKTIVPKVEVYYFHFTHRCVTCQAVETETLKALPALYPKLFKAKKITFTSVNLDEKSSEPIALKCNAEGQSLIIIGNGKRIDLTEQGFMYARSKPEKLKIELKRVIDLLLKK